MHSRKTALNPNICKARLSTDTTGNILSYGREHNHPANSLEIQVKWSKNLLYLWQNLLFLDNFQICGNSSNKVLDMFFAYMFLEI